MKATTSSLALFAHLSSPEEQARFFGAVFTEIQSCLLRRDELLARERLGKAPQNGGD